MNNPNFPVIDITKKGPTQGENLSRAMALKKGEITDSSESLPAPEMITIERAIKWYEDRVAKQKDEYQFASYATLFGQTANWLRELMSSKYKKGGQE